MYNFIYILSYENDLLNMFIVFTVKNFFYLNVMFFCVILGQLCQYSMPK